MFDRINKMLDYTLENVDDEDLSDVLIKIEKTFEFRFAELELAHVKTYGEMCDIIHTKLNYDHSATCTSQQAFYKLREGITSAFNIDGKKLLPDTLLNDLLPRKNRIKNTKILEKHLNMKISILSMPGWALAFLLVLLLVSFGAFFFDWKIALSGLGLSFLGFWIGNLFGKELDGVTMAAVADKMTREHYVKSRRNQNSINRNEIRKVIDNLFVEELGLEPSDLTDDAKFNFSTS